MRNRIFKFISISSIIVISIIVILFNNFKTEHVTSKSNISPETTNTCQIYLQSSDGEATSRLFKLKDIEQLEYQLTNKNSNEVIWKLIKKGLIQDSEIDSGILNDKVSSTIEFSKKGTYYFKGYTTNGAAIDVHCTIKAENISILYFID